MKSEVLLISLSAPIGKSKNWTGIVYFDGGKYRTFSGNRTPLATVRTLLQAVEKVELADANACNV